MAKSSQEIVNDCLRKTPEELEIIIESREGTDRGNTIAKGVYRQKTGRDWKSKQEIYDDNYYS